MTPEQKRIEIEKAWEFREKERLLEEILKRGYIHTLAKVDAREEFGDSTMNEEEYREHVRAMRVFYYGDNE